MLSDFRNCLFSSRLPFRMALVGTAIFAGIDSYAGAAVLTPVVKDTFISSTNSSTSNGSGVALEVITYTDNTEGDSRIIFITFDVSALTQPVSSASFSIQKVSGRGDRSVKMYGVTDESFDAWDESTLTWDNTAQVVTGSGASLQNETLLGEIGTSAPRNNGEIVYSWADTDGNPTADPLVAFLNSDTNGLVTFAFHQSVKNTNEFIFASRENTTSGYIVPTLNVVTIPEPASLALLGLGGLCLLGRRR